MTTMAVVVSGDSDVRDEQMQIKQRKRLHRKRPWELSLACDGTALNCEDPNGKMIGMDVATTRYSNHHETTLSMNNIIESGRSRPKIITEKMLTYTILFLVTVVYHSGQISSFVPIIVRPSQSSPVVLSFSSLTHGQHGRTISRTSCRFQDCSLRTKPLSSSAAAIEEDVGKDTTTSPRMMNETNSHDLVDTSQSSSFSSHSLTRPSSFDPDYLRKEYTVKQLKDFVRDGIHEKDERPSGLSKFKKDQVIEWIYTNQNKFLVDEHVEKATLSAVENEIKTTDATKKTKKKTKDSHAQNDDDNRGGRPNGPIGMPPRLSLESPTTTMTGKSTKQSSLSRRDMVHNELYDLYPPLRPEIEHYWKLRTNFRSKTHEDQNEEKKTQIQIDGEDIQHTEIVASLPVTVTTGLGENDFRQHYHPMLKSSSLAESSMEEVYDDGEDEGIVDDSGEDSGNAVSSSSSTSLSGIKTNVRSGEMDIIFVGTASCTPGTTRGVSCTALRINHQHTFGTSGRTGGTWLFDVGESTQLQVQRTSAIRPSKINKIFLTHAHGDHTFGLPGLLCLMGQDRPQSSPNDDNDNEVVDIYGPEGLRMWLRVAIRYSVSRIVPKYRVHELKDVPMAPEWRYSPRAQRYIYRGLSNSKDADVGWSDPDTAFRHSSDHWLRRYDRIDLPPSERYGEVSGGRDIYPYYGHHLSSDGAPVWEVEGFEGDNKGNTKSKKGKNVNVSDDTDSVKVYAAPMSHGIPCVGYSIQEMDRPGRLKDEIVRPIVEQNLEGLKNEMGYKHPLKSMADIKNMQPGESFMFPDGTALTQEEAVDPPKAGRRVVVLGDTSSARAMSRLAHEADVVIHEATNTYLYGVDPPTANLRDVTKDAIFHGHSTPHMAGLFAKNVDAKRLILNHFSARYKGNADLDGMTIMHQIEQQAMSKSGLEHDSVVAAWDMMIYPIPLRST